MVTRLTRLLLHSLTGAVLGYGLLHPCSMLIHSGLDHGLGHGWAAVRPSFTLEHAPMAAYFALLGALLGVGYGILSLRMHALLDEVAVLARTDPLTGLRNRREMLNALDRELSIASRHRRLLWVAMVDLDHFKRYNDRNGHQRGDDLLRQLADLVRRSLRASDIAARYGGDELIAILPEGDGTTGYALAERIRHVVAATSFFGGEMLPAGRVTVSVGLASYPQDAGDAKGLIECADAALLRAKALGRDRACSSGALGPGPADVHVPSRTLPWGALGPWPATRRRL